MTAAVIGTTADSIDAPKAKHFETKLVKSRRWPRVIHVKCSSSSPRLVACLGVLVVQCLDGAYLGTCYPRAVIAESSYCVHPSLRTSD